MPKKDGEVTASLEDYLEAIYFLNGETQDVRVTDLAIYMGISKPSVNRAINTLKSRGYVEHEHYGCLHLTADGLTIARSVADRHITLKHFLMDVLHVEETIAGEEACRMEHCLSADTIKKLQDYMKRI